MRPWLRNVALLGLTVVLVAVFLRNADLSRVWDVMRTANPALVGVGVVCVFLSYVLRAVRWQVMLAPLGPTRFSVALRATTIGFAASFILPARAGEVLRPWLLARREGLDASAVFATIIVERMLDLVTVLTLLAVFLLAFDPGLSALDAAAFATVRAGGFAAAGAAVVGLGVLFMFASRPALLGRTVAMATAWLPAKLRITVAGMAAAFAGGLAVVREPSHLARALAWSFVLWLLIAAQTWIVSVALGVEPAAERVAAARGVARGRRRGADPRRRRRVPRGLPDWRHLVLRRRQRPRGRRRDRAPRRSASCPR